MRNNYWFDNVAFLFFLHIEKRENMLLLFKETFSTSSDIGVTYCCQVVSVILNYFFFSRNKTTSIRCSHMKDVFRLPDKMLYGKIKDIHNLPFGMQTPPFKLIYLINVFTFYSFVSSSLVLSFQLI